MAFTKKQLETIVADSGTTQEDMGHIKKDLRRSEWIMGAFIVVMFIGLVGLSFTLGTLMVDDYRTKEASYQDLIDKINEQGNKLDIIEAGLKEYHIIPAY